MTLPARPVGPMIGGIVMDLATLPRRWHAADLLLYLVGVYRVAFALTGVWLGMRSVMDIGGSCASGGPYEIATPCPAGVDVLLTLGIPLGIVSAGLMVWKGSRIGAAYAGLVALAWPVLFLSLGWNFLEYGVRNPFGEGVELGCRWRARHLRDHGRRATARLVGGARPRPRRAGRPVDHDAHRAQRAGQRDAPGVAAGQPAAASTMTVADAPRATRGARPVTWSRRRQCDAVVEPNGMIDQLERLARLRESGALTDQEYDDAKVAIIGAASRGELG